MSGKTKSRTKSQPQNSKPVARVAGGKFAKGVSGNPGGRPKAMRELVLAAQQHGEEGLRTLVRLMQTGEPDAVKLGAVKEILDRGYGKSPQKVDIGSDPKRPVVFEALDTDEMRQLRELVAKGTAAAVSSEDDDPDGEA